MSDDRLPVYVLFGIGGLLGDAFYARLCEKIPNHRIFAFDHLRMDIGNRTNVAPVLSYISPTVVINCAAINDPDLCEDATEGAFYSNATGPKILAEESAKCKAKFVHISACTVYPMDGTKSNSESSKTDPFNAHGRSKLAGEKAALQTNPDSLIIRPGWCFHYEGDNYLTDWIARAERGLNISVPRDCQGSPTYVADMVEAVLTLVDRDASGIFNIANSGSATWTEMAEMVGELTKTNMKIKAVSTELKSLFKSQVQKHAVLSVAKYFNFTGKRIRKWDVALRQCLYQMHRYKP